MLNSPTKKLTRAGVIAALYIVLTLAAFPIAGSAVQFRPSEALTLLPLLYAEALPALFIGCVLSNLILGCAVYDVVLGGLITLFASLLTYICGKYIKGKKVLAIGGVFPVLLNALLLPLVWYLCYGKIEYLYIVSAGFLFISQAISVYGLGVPLMIGITKLKDKGIDFLK